MLKKAGIGASIVVMLLLAYQLTVPALLGWKPITIRWRHDIRYLQEDTSDAVRPTFDARGTAPIGEIPLEYRLNVEWSPPVVYPMCDLVVRAVAPGSWDYDRGTTLEERGGVLEVVHTPYVQWQVASLLRRVRDEQWLRVHLDVSMVTLTGNGEAVPDNALFSPVELLPGDHARFNERMGFYCFDGQRSYTMGGTVTRIGDRGKLTGPLVEIRPTVSPNRESVALEVHIEYYAGDGDGNRLAWHAEARASCPNGGSVVVKGAAGSRPGVAALVSPRVLDLEEHVREEQLFWQRFEDEWGELELME